MEKVPNKEFLEGVKGVFEIHIFVGPINPDDETLNRFKGTCNSNGMKPLFLFLQYEHIGPAGVMQSSCYVSGTFDKAYEKSLENVKAFEDAGLQVLRNK